MNSVIESQLKKFSEQNDLLGYERDELFEIFSIFCVEKGILNSEAEPLNVHLEGSEFGIDGVCIMVNGEQISSSSELTEIDNIDHVEFRFYQAKTSEKFALGDILKFFEAVYNFFDHDFESTSDVLMELHDTKEEIFSNSSDMENNPKISLYYISTGNYKEPDPIKLAIESCQDRLEDKSLFDEISVEMMDAKLVQSAYRNANQGIKNTISIAKVENLPSVSEIEQSYIGYVEASEVVKLITTKETNNINKLVFFENIRDFNPDSEINKKISESLRRGEGDFFVFRNNGITAVAKKVKRTGDRFTVSDYQIVNGCQTSHVLFENKEYLKDVFVPIKLIEAKSDDIISSIIIGTNSQNPVQKEQFWALTPFMKNLEEYCSSLSDDERLFIERREGQYRGQNVEKSRIIKSKPLFKAISSVVIFVGNRAGRFYAAVFKEYSQELFKDEHEVSIYHAAAFIHYRLEYLWRRNLIDRKYKMFRYFLLTGLGRVLSGNKKLLEMPPKKAKNIALKMIDVAKKDDDLIKIINKMTKAIDKETKSLSKKENLRDHIKTDAVSKRILEAVSSV